MKYILIGIVLLFVLIFVAAFIWTLLVKFKWFFITLGILIVAIVVFRIVMKQKRALDQPIEAVPSTETNSGNITAPQMNALGQPIEAVPNTETNSGNITVAQKSAWQIRQEEEEKRRTAAAVAAEEKKAAFDAELTAVPTVDIPLTEPVPRRRIKDMPEYSFSNITRKTRMDSIFPLVVLDVETTGFAPSKCEIIEIAAIKFDFGMEPVAAFSTLCKPKKPIPPEATEVNHITDDMVADAPEFAQIAPALTEFLSGCHIVGHNLDFDLRFVFVNGTDFSTKMRLYDTLDLAHLTIPESRIWNYKLDTICSYYGIMRGTTHRALSDAYATSKVFTKLVYDKTSRRLDAFNNDSSEFVE